MGKKVLVLTESQIKRVLSKIVAEQTMSQPTAQNKIQVLGQSIMNAIKSGQLFFRDPMFPKNIIGSYGTRMKSEDMGVIYFYVLPIPADRGVSSGVLYEIPVYPASTDVKITDDKSIFDLYTSNKVKISNELKKVSETSTLTLAQIMLFIGGDKNPKVFLDFIKQIEPNSENWLKDSLRSLSLSTDTNYREQAKKIYQFLFP